MSSSRNLNKEKLVSIVLVNYKTYKMTSICLGLLYDFYKKSNIQVWVVDNDSQDESTEKLRSLDWIHLVERKPIYGEPGFMAHGRALDIAMEKIDTDYLFILHTDTLVYDYTVFDIMLDICMKNKEIAVVGCVDQVLRGQIRIIRRFVTRFIKHYFRQLKLFLCINSRPPKPYYEVYIKSFCALWNIKLMKKHGMIFTSDTRLPGYEAQDKLTEKGYQVSLIPSKKLFSYLDHIKAGTKAAKGNFLENYRRGNILKK